MAGFGLFVFEANGPVTTGMTGSSLCPVWQGIVRDPVELSEVFPPEAGALADVDEAPESTPSLTS